MAWPTVEAHPTPDIRSSQLVDHRSADDGLWDVASMCLIDAMQRSRRSLPHEAGTIEDTSTWLACLQKRKVGDDRLGPKASYIEQGPTRTGAISIAGQQSFLS